MKAPPIPLPAHRPTVRLPGGFTPAVGGDFAEIDDEDGDLPF